MRSVGWKCERCKKKATQVHHKRYVDARGQSILNREELTDTEALCRGCHRGEHFGSVMLLERLFSLATLKMLFGVLLSAIRFLRWLCRALLSATRRTR